MSAESTQPRNDTPCKHSTREQSFIPIYAEESNQKLSREAFPLTQWSSIKRALACGSLLAIGDSITLFIASSITFSIVDVTALESWLVAALSSIFIIIATATGQYWRRTPFWDRVLVLIKAFSALSLAHLSLSLNPAMEGNHSILVLNWALAFALIIITRSALKALLLKLSLWQIPTVIIGDGPNAKETALALMDETLLGYEIVSFLSPSPSHVIEMEVNNKVFPVRYINNRTSTVLRRLGTPNVVIALERGGTEKIQKYIEQLTLNYPCISVVPALRGLPLFQAKASHFFSHEVMMLHMQSNLSRIGAKTTKRLFDIVVASSILVMISPIFLLLAYLVKKTGKQVFFGHERIGQNGRSFRCYKFRSMVENSKEVLDQLLANDDDARREWYRDFKLKNDPRITTVGKFLRKSSLDELPQLWNVIKGEMSLVGPRPVIADEIPYYGTYVDFYHKCRPGMTGLWQVSGRSDLDYNSRVQLDVWYVSNWSLWNDIVIMFRTISVVCGRSGAY